MKYLQSAGSGGGRSKHVGKRGCSRKFQEPSCYSVWPVNFWQSVSSVASLRSEVRILELGFCKNLLAGTCPWRHHLVTTGIEAFRLNRLQGKWRLEEGKELLRKARQTPRASCSRCQQASLLAWQVEIETPRAQLKTPQVRVPCALHMHTLQR